MEADVSKFDFICKNIRKFFNTSALFETYISSIKRNVFKGQMADDIKRNRKLNHLRKSRTFPRLQESNTVNLYNFTGVDIPPEVRSLLRFGPKLGVGGADFSGSKTVLELEKMFKAFKIKAHEFGINQDR